MRGWPQRTGFFQLPNAVISTVVDSSKAFMKGCVQLYAFYVSPPSEFAHRPLG
jgi:hypothetical protein